MLIVWGFRNTEKVLGYTQPPYNCGHCNNVSYHKVFRRIKWFTLFWIPIIPVSFSYYGCCPICNYGQRLNKEQAFELAQRQKDQIGQNGVG